MKSALICGISGQDGGYLAKLLIEKGYEVWGTSRDAKNTSFSNLENLEIKESIKLVTMKPENYQNVFEVIVRSKAQEIYFLSGQSSVGLSFIYPVESITCATLGALNILEAARKINLNKKFFFAVSSEMFGDNGGIPISENSSLNPSNPYAVGKASQFWIVKNYRQIFSQYACSGILFNHESPVRSENFVTQKIINAAYRISKGSNEFLKLGNLKVARDWGWAPEYVKAMWLMLQQNSPEDYIIATGKTYTLQEFVCEAFLFYNLNWKDFVEYSKELDRPTEIVISKADVSKTKKNLSWLAKYDMKDVVKLISLSKK